MECGGGGRRRRGPEQSAGEMKGTGQMGRLGQLRPARIAKTRGGQGQARSFCTLRALGADVASCAGAPRVQKW